MSVVVRGTTYMLYSILFCSRAVNCSHRSSAVRACAPTKKPERAVWTPSQLQTAVEHFRPADRKRRPTPTEYDDDDVTTRAHCRARQNRDKPERATGRGRRNVHAARRVARDIGSWSVDVTAPSKTDPRESRRENSVVAPPCHVRSRQSSAVPSCDVVESETIADTGNACASARESVAERI
ncbi:unnamed protein product [Aphis gossypii]|uniref:Uncharacterized protein n=1 Tax=Aphis gossypii TaxID=80765 RepID=A0A9P0NG12_APHGO|nr:unnamed protein product [Aphis gossypii]